MVYVDINSLPANDQYLAEFLSDDSDTEDQEAFIQKCNEIETLVKLNETFPNTVMIVGTPKAPEEKCEKLKNVLRRLFTEFLSKKGLIISGFIIDMPLNEEKTTMGFCFVTFQSSEEAQHASRLLDQFTIDASHTCKTCVVDKVDAVAYHDEAFYSPNRILGFTREGLRWWMHDEKCREQFFLRYEDKLKVFWYDNNEYDPILLYEKTNSKDLQNITSGARIQWSPQGSYLVVFHKLGISLLADSNFSEKMFFEHPNANQIKFSPNEEYILTWESFYSSQILNSSKFSQIPLVKLWKTTTGELITSFQPPSDHLGADIPSSFTYFLWSHDDSYLAHVIEEVIYIYSLPTMELITDDKNRRGSLKDIINKFMWSPGDNVLSIWTPETTNTPGRLMLVEVPSLKILASKNIYNVHEASASMHWQAKGNYLALRALIAKKTGKKAKKTLTQLEIFQIREKNIPVDIIQIESASVKQLQWEDGDSKRFVLVVEDEMLQQSLRFYKVSYVQGYSDVILIATLDIASQINFMKWSPQGTHFILASKLSETSTKTSDYSLMFCALTDNDIVEVLHKDQHFFVNDLLWSSCGRYLSTIVSSPLSKTNYRNTSDLGFIMWNFQGKKQFDANISQLYQFQWRPHPPLFSSSKKIEDIKKSLNHFSKRFDALDERARAIQREIILKNRNKQNEAFDLIMADLEHWKMTHDEYYEWLKAEELFDNSLEWETYTKVEEKEVEVIEQIIGKL